MNEWKKLSGLIDDYKFNKGNKKLEKKLKKVNEKISKVINKLKSENFIMYSCHKLYSETDMLYNDINDISNLLDKVLDKYEKEIDNIASNNTQATIKIKKELDSLVFDMNKNYEENQEAISRAKNEYDKFRSDLEKKYITKEITPEQEKYVKFLGLKIFDAEKNLEKSYKNNSGRCNSLINKLRAKYVLQTSPNIYQNKVENKEEKQELGLVKHKKGIIQRLGAFAAAMLVGMGASAPNDKTDNNAKSEKIISGNSISSNFDVGEENKEKIDVITFIENDDNLEKETKVKKTEEKQEQILKVKGTWLNKSLECGEVLKFQKGMKFLEGIDGGNFGEIGTSMSPEDAFYIIDRVAKRTNEGIVNEYRLDGKITDDSKQIVHISLIKGAKTVEEAYKILNEQKSKEKVDNEVICSRGWITYDDALNNSEKAFQKMMNIDEEGR